MAAACFNHAFVVIELGVGEETPVRFNARPLNGEAITVEAQARQKRDVFLVAVIAVAGVTRPLDVHRWLDVFKKPQIGVCVVAFDLMTRRCYTPAEILRKCFAGGLRGGEHRNTAVNCCHNRSTCHSRDEFAPACSSPSFPSTPTHPPDFTISSDTHSRHCHESQCIRFHTLSPSTGAGIHRTLRSCVCSTGIRPRPRMQLPSSGLVQFVHDRVRISIRRPVVDGAPELAEVALHPLQLAERKLHFPAALQGTDHPHQYYVHNQNRLAARQALSLQLPN